MQMRGRRVRKYHILLGINGLSERRYIQYRYVCDTVYYPYIAHVCEIDVLCPFIFFLCDSAANPLIRPASGVKALVFYIINLLCDHY